LHCQFAVGTYRAVIRDRQQQRSHHVLQSIALRVYKQIAGTL
jgi:hypothetical protein